MKILHLADVHIDEKKTVNGRIIYDETGINIRLNDLLNCLKQIKQTAQKEKVSLILIAGDLFERKNPSSFETYIATRELFEFSQIAPVIVTIGNHDAENAVRAFAFIKNVHVPEPFTPITFNGTTVFTVPYPDLSQGPAQKVKQLYEEKIIETSRTVKDRDSFLIALCHAAVEGASYPTSGSIDEVALSPSCFEYTDYAALGHIHKPQRIKNVHYPGSVDTWRRQEADTEKGFYIVDTDTKQVTFHRIKTRRLHNLSFSLDTIPAVIKVEDGSIVRIEVEIPEEKLSDYDPAGVKRVIAGNPLDVKVVPTVIKTRRLRCEEITKANTSIEIIKTYMKNKNLPQDRITRIMEKINQLIKETHMEEKVC